MAEYQDPLSGVKIASPCTADWESMLGNERQRFCGQCQLNVYNLSGMTKREAENLVSHAEGRLCVRFYRRADGTILTQNCPVGLRALKRRISRVATAALSTVLGFFSGLGLYTASNETVPETKMGVLEAPLRGRTINTNSNPIRHEKLVEVETGMLVATPIHTQKKISSPRRKQR
ncbi:MAG: hypothetical protein H7Y30_08550 [Pyrinomonadaceae bacterium]|nr:hypothetical protein [Pyrinomonadaceae bacterium]